MQKAQPSAHCTTAFGSISNGRHPCCSTIHGQVSTNDNVVCPKHCVANSVSHTETLFVKRSFACNLFPTVVLLRFSGKEATATTNQKMPHMQLRNYKPEGCRIRALYS